MLEGRRDTRPLGLLGLPGDVQCAMSRLGIHSAEDLERGREVTRRYLRSEQRLPNTLQLHYSGHPGAGKTQLGLQIAINVQLPSFLGGVSGECLFIDTEGSVMPKRVAEIAKGTLEWAQPALQANLHRAEVEQLSEARLLSGIHYLRAKSAAQQVAACMGLLYTLPQSVKLVVVDSAAFLFRVSQYAVNKNVSVRMLHNMMSSLRRLAARGVAVVVTNHVTYQERKDAANVSPALGDSWSSEPMHRIQLQVAQETRIARVWKSSCLPPGQAEYAVTGDGIRDAQSPP